MVLMIMVKFFKITLYFILTLSVALVLIIMSLLLWFDPNDHKTHITALLKQHTGRDIELQEDIRLSIFPWIALELGQVRVRNPPDFDDRDFAIMERAEIRLKLVPLFSKRIEMDTIELHGMTLYLSRDGNGRSNWQDWGDKRAQDSAAPVPNIHINGVDFSNAQIYWHDAVSGADYHLSNINLNTGVLNPNQPFDLSLSFYFYDGASISTQITLKGRITPDLRQGRAHKIESLNLMLHHASMPGAALSLQVQDLHFDHTQGTLTLARLGIAAVGINAEIVAFSANLHGQFAGTVRSTPFDLGVVLEKIGHNIALPQILRHNIHFSAQFNGDMSRLELQHIALESALQNVKIPHLALNWAQQSLDADHIQWRLWDTLIQIQLHAKTLFTTPQFDAHVNVAEFNPRTLLHHSGMPPLILRDPKALSHAALTFQAHASMSELNLSQLHLSLDQSQAQGWLKLDFGDKLALSFDVSMDNLNLSNSRRQKSMTKTAVI
jgi:AsmA protein